MLFKFNKGTSSNWCNDEKVNLYFDKDLVKAYYEDVQFEGDQNITFNQHTEQDGELVQDVIFHTINVLDEFVLYLGRKTKGGVKAYVELMFTLEEIMVDQKLLDRVN